MRITVPGSAIDTLGHVNNLVYLQWCLEAAEAHWKLVASDSLQQHYVWYVLRHSIDYKNEDVIAGLKRECPKGVNVYFDNVGGDILDAVLTRLAFKARVIICGAISQYNNKQAVKGPANYLNLLVNSARMEGMVVMTYAPRFAEAAVEMGGWLASGKLKSKEDIVSGLTTFPETLLKLFSGENFGKLVLDVD